jgi:phytanoyl-CoA hydroxylase
MALLSALLRAHHKLSRGAEATCVLMVARLLSYVHSMVMATTQFSFDDEPGLHDPRLYDYAALAEGVPDLDAIGEAEIARYHADGVLAVRGAFTPDEVQSALDGLTDLIAGRVAEFTNIQFRGDVRERLEELDVEERINAVRRLLYFTDYEPRLKALALHPKLLAAVGKLLGTEPELFQSMALIKPPRGREKPWHQDHAYFELPLDVRVVGVWIALEEAGVENGCMRFLPGWHRQDGQPRRWPHFNRRDLQICDSEMMGLEQQRVAAPLAPGGLVLFDSYIPHGTPSNFTQQRRRAAQFHYLPPGAPRITAAERVAIWDGDKQRLYREVCAER